MAKKKRPEYTGVDVANGIETTVVTRRNRDGSLVIVKVIRRAV